MTFCDNINKLAEIVTSSEGLRKKQTFSRSILASVLILVSRIKLRIHFSPSSCERLRRSERLLQVSTCHPTKKLMLSKNDLRNVNLLIYPAISLADQISKKFVFEFAQKEIISNNFFR